MDRNIGNEMVLWTSTDNWLLLDTLRYEKSENMRLSWIALLRH